MKDSNLTKYENKNKCYDCLFFKLKNNSFGICDKRTFVGMVHRFFNCNLFYKLIK